jgi:hypothetical protein
MDMNITTLPGERLVTLADGTMRLTMRNGTMRDFTPEEWEEFRADFNENLQASELIDCVIDTLKGRDLVSTNEMIDALLDIRNRAVRTEEGSKNLARLWMEASGLSQHSDEESEESVDTI